MSHLLSNSLDIKQFYHVLPLQARVGVEAMAMKGLSALPKTTVLLESLHQTVHCHMQDTCWGWSYPSAKIQSMYSTAPSDWTERV